MMRRFSIVTAALVAFGALAATPAQCAEKVRLLMPTVKELPSFAPWILADYEGFYKAEGLEVEFLTGHGGVDAATQVGAGNADLSEGIGDTSLIVRSNGVPVKAVTVLGGGGLMQLVVRKDAKIASLKDLKGKSITVVNYTDSTYYALLGMLASVGLTKDDVNIQGVGPANLVNLVVNGSVQAAACVPDWVVKIEDAGIAIDVYPSAEYVPSMSQAVIASDKTIKERPEMIRKFVRATLKAMVQIRDNPVGMASVYVKALPVHQKDEAQLGRVYTAYAKYVYGGKQSKLGAMDPERLQKLEDLYLSQNIIRKKVPVGDLYTNEFLP
jgi:NitT/TauT family transport system substrate-binding protein